MATILVVDDRQNNREYLATLLGYRQHRVLESKDGADGVETALRERPDLVISDILMPVMDGYELIRKLRENPATAAIPVILWTAHYLEREARALAEKSGAIDVITKPCEPEDVLRVVDYALASGPAASTSPNDFNHEHLRLVTNKLSRKTDEAYWANLRLRALVKAILELSTEKDPEQLLEFACREAREMIGSASAIIGMPEGERQPGQFCIRGAETRLDREFCNALHQSEAVQAMLARQKPLRIPMPGKSATPGLLPFTEYPIESFLSVPIATPTRAYGSFVFLNKVGVAAFDEQDEQIAQAFAAEVASVYEGLLLYKEVSRLASDLTRLNGELRQCSHIASHQLQEPLRSIHGFTELLARRYRGRLDSQADEALDFLQGGVRRMRSLIRDLAEYARIAQPSVGPRQVVALTHAAGAAWESVSQAIKATGALVTVDELPIVRGDSRQLQQVFDHLITNAIKFRSPDRPRIAIRSQDRDGVHVISVEDNGVGIAPQHHERIFNAFERLQTDEEGTGIGLALCRKIIDGHGGRLWVESAIGAGSTFFFTLPMLPPRNAGQ